MVKLPEQALCEDEIRSGPDLGPSIEALDSGVWDYSGIGDRQWFCDAVAGHSGSPPASRA